MPILLLAVGLLFLYAGAEALVRGSSSLALRLGVTPLVVGLTVVAAGTSSPELVVSVRAALAGEGGIALGNVVGSNIANMALILGLCALLRPLRVNPQVLRLDLPVLLAASLLLPLLLRSGRLSRLSGLLLLACALLYLLVSLYVARRAADRRPPLPARPAGRRFAAAVDLALAAAGVALLVAGGKFLVDAAVVLATRLGVSQAVVGLTVVAVGTSLPELATSLVATLRHQSDIAVGNVVGSNSFNILVILGAAATVRPFSTGGVTGVDLAVMILFAVLALPIMATRFRVSRTEGALLLAGYAGYVTYLAL